MEESKELISERVIDHGSFAVVYESTINGERVAIKKVFQDPRYKNREVQVISGLSHPHIIPLKDSFYSRGSNEEEVYLNIVMEYMPLNLFKVIKSYSKRREAMPLSLVKLYSYQILRAVGYLHAKGYAHRDIKPQNFLVDESSQTVKLCDFGSAKRLARGEPSVSYICSRYYRAPELIFGATDYTQSIDMWSVGCVIAEMVLKRPIFQGESGVDQLIEIIKVLGTPNREQLRLMNPNYTEFRFPDIKPSGLAKALGNEVPPKIVEFLMMFFVYEPNMRPHPIEVLTHPFFDEVRQQFSFTHEELAGVSDDAKRKLF